MTTHAPIGHNMPPIAPEPHFGGWIKVYRDIRRHPIVGQRLPVKPADPNFGASSRGEAWQDLVMEASYKPSRRQNKGRDIWLEAGDLMAAHSFLAERWNWTVKQVRRFLDVLESEGMITRPHIDERASEGQAKGKQKGKQEDTQKGKQSDASGSSSKPNSIQIITISKYSAFQAYDDAISEANLRLLDYDFYGEGQANGQPEGHIASQQHGPKEGNNLRNKQTIALNDSAGAPEENRSKPIAPASKHNPEKNPDPFGLNPGRHHPDVIRSDAGELTLLNGKRSDWLSRFDGDETGLDLALMQIADKVQPNSTRTIEVQVEAQLAGIIQRKREQDQRYLKAASRNSVRAKAPGTTGAGVMSLEERLQIERERKAGAAQ